jgi:hypothetical protein
MVRWFDRVFIAERRTGRDQEKDGWKDKNIQKSVFHFFRSMCVSAVKLKNYNPGAEDAR